MTLNTKMNIDTNTLTPGLPISLSLGGGGGEGFSLHGIAEWISSNAFKRLGVSITVKID